MITYETRREREAGNRVLAANKLCQYGTFPTDLALYWTFTTDKYQTELQDIDFPELN
jgi:hypothetical protein